MRIATLGSILFFSAFIPTEAFAHDGLHHHPHGIDYGWIIACAVGICGGYALSSVKGWRK